MNTLGSARGRATASGQGHPSVRGQGHFPLSDIRLHGKGDSKLPWSKAGQPSQLVDVVDLDQ